jgi:hypothetical protein
MRLELPPSPGATRAIQAMLQMTKINIAKLEAAARGLSRPSHAELVEA